MFVVFGECPKITKNLKINFKKSLKTKKILGKNEYTYTPIFAILEILILTRCLRSHQVQNPKGVP